MGRYEKHAHSELVRALSETGEALIDLGLESEVVKAIPVVNLVAALVKEVVNIRDRVLISNSFDSEFSSSAALFSEFRVQISGRETLLFRHSPHWSGMPVQT